MKQMWQYALVALGGVTLGGATCGPSGYALGYISHKPDLVVEDLNDDGNDDLCVMMDKSKAWCAMDYNRDGAQDIVEIDLTKIELKVISYGKNPCQIRSLDELLKDPKQPINL